MESYMAGKRYMQRRSAPYRRRSGTIMRQGRLRRLIALQSLICVIIFLIMIIAKSVNISAAGFVTENARYILEHNVELKSIYAYTRTLVADIRDSIVTDRRSPRENERTAVDLPKDGGDDAAVSDTLSEQNVFEGTVDASSGINSSADDASVRYADNGGEFRETGVLSASSDEEESPPVGLSGGGYGSAEMETPVEGELVTPFGEIAAAAGMRKMHNGIDIAVEGTGNVKAVMDGYVTDAGSSPGYGNFIKIDHGSGFATVYANCSSIAAEINDFVKKGDVIAGVGGERVTGGRHLHFEIWLDGVPADPLDYMSITAR